MFGSDNDGDNLYDGNDPDCSASCTETGISETECNGVDDDCDGLIDEDYIATTTFCGDGVCANDGLLECQDGQLVDNCAVLPPEAATDEICDGRNEDCAGGIDEDYTPVPTTCGVGECAGNTGADVCQSGSVNDTCDPFAGATTEICDELDNDCDGIADEGFDVDGDGYTTCNADCNDNDAAINPDAVDIPNNGIDENCDGADSVDTDLLDTDNDGFTPADGDCNDADAAINPAAIDIPNNGIDENCDGADSVDTDLLDTDNDGFTPADGDCNDADAFINPDAFDIPNNGIDENCDGADSVDTDLLDTDNDGFSPADGDCNDADATFNPGAVDVCGNGVDENCDGMDEVCLPDPVCGDGNVDAGEVCDDGNTTNGDGCENDCTVTTGVCSDGNLPVITEMEYNQGDEKLHIKGRAATGTTISIINSDSGQILAEGIMVREGKWEAEIKDVGSHLESISVISSNGCAVDQEIKSDREDDNHEDDDHEDDDHEDDDRKDRPRRDRRR